MKRIILHLLAVVSVGVIFANGTAEETTRSITTKHTILEYETVGEMQIKPSAEIIEIFVDHENDDYEVLEEHLATDVDAKNLSDKVLEDIDAILAEDPDDLKEKIVDELASYLKEGNIECTFMVLGRNVFCSRYDF